MATERTARKRAFQAANDVARWWLLLPMIGLILFNIPGPYHASTKTQYIVLITIDTILLLLSFACTLTFCIMVFPAGYTEYRYGEAMRRTGLTRRRLFDLISTVPYNVERRWLAKKMMLAEWSIEEFLDFYKEEKLMRARQDLSTAVVTCKVYEANAAHHNKDFDAEAFMRKARQKYLREKRHIEGLTTIPS